MTISDNFNRSNAATIGTASDGGTWTTYPTDATCEIVSNKARFTSIGTSPWFAGGYGVELRDTGQVDADETIDITITSTSIDVIPIGYDTVTKQGYFIRIANGSCQLRSVNGSSNTNLASYSAASSGTHTFRVVRTNSTGVVEVFIDSVSQGTQTDTTYSGGTWVGFGSASTNDSQFDNFSASSLTVTPVSDSDARTSSESATVAISVSSSDSGVSSGTPAIALSATEARTSSQTTSTVASLSAIDAYTGSSSTSLAVTLWLTPVTDACSASETANLPSPISLDAGSVGETVSLAVTLAVVEQYSFNEVGSSSGSPESAPEPLIALTPGGLQFTSWAFIDPQGVKDTYVFAFNPNKMTDPTKKKSFEDFGRSPISNGVRALSTHRQAPREWSFSGTTRVQSQHNKFLEWYRLNRKIWIRDHFGRIWEVRLLNYAPEPRRSTATNSWRYSYTFSGKVYRRVS